MARDFHAFAEYIHCLFGCALCSLRRNKLHYAAIVIVTFEAMNNTVNNLFAYLYLFQLRLYTLVESEIVLNDVVAVVVVVVVVDDDDITCSCRVCVEGGEIAIGLSLIHAPAPVRRRRAFYCQQWPYSALYYRPFRL